MPAFVPVEQHVITQLDCIAQRSRQWQEQSPTDSREAMAIAEELADSSYPNGGMLRDPDVGDALRYVHSFLGRIVLKDENLAQALASVRDQLAPIIDHSAESGEEKDAIAPGMRRFIVTLDVEPFDVGPNAGVDEDEAGLTEETLRADLQGALDEYDGVRVRGFVVECREA